MTPAQSEIEAAARALAWAYLDNGFYNTQDPALLRYRDERIEEDWPRWVSQARAALIAASRHRIEAGPSAAMVEAAAFQSSDWNIWRAMEEQRLKELEG